DWAQDRPADANRHPKSSLMCGGDATWSLLV
ncbi:unnamed protein product, partial [marine sediment metagenome]